MQAQQVVWKVHIWNTQQHNMDGFLLENGIDRYLMEDGLGIYLLEQQGGAAPAVAVYSTQMNLMGLGS